MITQAILPSSFRSFIRTPAGSSLPPHNEPKTTVLGREILEADIGSITAKAHSVRVSTVEASRSEGSVWISPVFAQTNGRSGEYRRAAENCVQCARAVSALAFAARAKGRFVRTV